MPSEDTADPIAVSTTLLLAASLLMENISADLVPSADPTAELLAKKVQLLTETVEQLRVLACAAQAAVRQHSH